MNRTLTFLSLLTFVSLPASADIFFDDFGVGHSYNGRIGWTVASAASSLPFAELAMAFTPSDSFRLTQIDVAIGHVVDTNSVILSLNSDSAGLPDGVIESWNLTNLQAFGTCCAFETVTPGSPLVLASGTQYWVVASPTAAWDAWNWNNTGATDHMAYNTGSGWVSVGGTWTGAFDVLGSPVPEPTSIVLLATVLASLGVAIRGHLPGKRQNLS